MHKRLLAGTWSLWTHATACAFALWLGACAGDTGEREQPVTVVPPEPSSGPCHLGDGAEPDPLTLELSTWNLQVSQRDWDKLHEDVYAEVDVPALLCVAGESYSIELELQGSSTRKLAKKSFDLKWKKSKPLRSWPFDRTAPQAQGPVAIRKVFLKAMAKDQSLIREALGYDLYQALGYETPNIGFANLRINGAYWGLYAVVEPVNESFIAAHGYPRGGRLYKAVRKHGSRADFAPSRDLTRAFETALVPQEGVDSDSDSEIEEDVEPQDRDVPDDTDDPANPEPAEPERVDESPTAPSEDDALPQEYAELQDLVSRFQTTPLEESAFESQIDHDFSLDAYFDRMLWVAFTQNGDAVAQNFFLYHSTSEQPARWYQVPWDSDIAFGADYRDVDSVIDTAASPLVDGGNYFSRRMLQVSGLRARYLASSLGILDREVLQSEGLQQLARYRARLSHDLDQDQARWKRQTDARTAFDRIESFITERGAVLRQALSEL